MRTPYGAECKYYYADFHRGRNYQECRLLEGTPDATNWNSGLCKDCAAPSIQRANACRNLVLQGKIARKFLGISRNMKISAYCIKSKQDVKEPHIGCGQCHGNNPLIDNLLKDL